MALVPRSDLGRKALEWGGISLVAVVVGLAIGGALGGSPPDDGVEVTTGSSPSTSSTTTSEPVVTTTAPETAPPPTTTSTTAAEEPARPASQVKVKLYNGSSVGGAAVVAGNELKAAGFVVQPPGPSTGKRAESSVWHKPGFEQEAASVAEALAAPTAAVALLPDPSPVAGVGNADVVVVVGDDVATT